MADTDTAGHVIQAETQQKYAIAVAQLDAYTAAGRQPPLLDRVDDAAQLRITFTQVSVLNLSPPE